MGTTGVQTASPMVGAGADMSGLGAALPFMLQATQSPAELAQQYMNPYINTAVKGMSDIAMRNIRQNLSPAATAAAVGSGQYGSQRGAQVLGQTQAQAMQDLNNQIAQMEQTGYGQALTAAGQQNALLAQLGLSAGNLTNTQALNLINAGLGLGAQQTSANQLAATLGATATGAQQAYNTSQLQAAQTAATAAQQQAAALQAAGLGMGTLGSQGQQMSLNDINALATMGAQQQQILQGAQDYPLKTLTTLAGLLQGYNVPTTTTTTLDQSPLSALVGLGAGAAGMFTANAQGKTPWDALTAAWNKMTGTNTAGTTLVSSNGGWQNFSDGTSIGPDGTYYFDGKAITGPGGVPLDTTEYPAGEIGRAHV